MKTSFTILALLLASSFAFGGAIAPGFNTNQFTPANTAGNSASGAPASAAGRCDDCYLDASVALGFSANFFGTTYTNAFVNNNGNITFNSGMATFTPFNLYTSGVPIIAPFFADVDTRGGGAVTAWGTGTYNGFGAFGVTWNGVGYYSFATNPLDYFQVILTDRSDTGAGNFDIYFNYDSMGWESGSASGGSGGLGGSCARAGYSNGNAGQSYELAGSGVCGSFLDGSPTSLAGNSNDGVTGQYEFSVRNGNVTPAPEPGSMLLLGSGLVTVASRIRRKK